MIGNINLQQVNEQFEKTLAGPVRSYAELTVDHVEKLADFQYNTAKAYMDMGLEQVRSALDIKDQSDVQAYVAKQQQLAQTLADRVRGDMEKVVELNKDFADRSRKVVEGGISNATRTAGKASAEPASTTKQAPKASTRKSTTTKSTATQKSAAAQ